MRVSPEDVLRIASMDEAPVLRNLLITLSYHELAVDLERLLGARDRSWCAHACWASKQAGVFIRKDLLPDIARRCVREGAGDRTPSVNGAEQAGRVRAREDELRRAIQPHLRLAERFDPLEAIDDVAQYISIYIGGGNKVVFAELGHLFARFLEAFPDGAGGDEAALEELIAPLREGSSLEDRVHLDEQGRLHAEMQGGQSLLRSAMRHFFEAMGETDSNRRSELILLGNAQCGLHEQTRIQPYIVGALDAPLEALLLEGVLRRAPSVDAGLRRAAGPFVDALSDLLRSLTTELIMTIEFPGQTLHLGRDIEAPPGLPLWPQSLARLEHPELVALTVTLKAYDTREASLDLWDRIEAWLDAICVKLGWGTPEAQGTGAEDWSSLSDRMRFIFELFRSRQQDLRLLEPPFLEPQVEAIRAGKIPSGPL